LSISAINVIRGSIIGRISVGHMFRFGVSERHKSPVILPSFIEDSGEALTVVSDATKIDWTNFHRGFPSARIHQRRNLETGALSGSSHQAYQSVTFSKPQAAINRT